ncbi:MAG: terminase large subunit domain-containing protein [Sphingomicrobium sp.]
MLAGRGFGKTRAGAEWIEKLARSRPGARIALAGATIDEGRRVMVEGVSGILAVAKRRRHRVKWEPSLGRLRWPNGSEAQLFSGDNPDGLRGPEHDFAWCAANPRRRRRRTAGKRDCRSRKRIDSELRSPRNIGASPGGAA